MMCSSLMFHPNLHLGPDFTSFTLYDNPHYNPTPQHHHHPIISHQKPPNSTPTMHNKGTHQQHEHELNCLRVELETERRMRRKFESLNEVMAMELAEERRAREEAERRLRLLLLVEGETGARKGEEVGPTDQSNLKDHRMISENYYQQRQRQRKGAENEIENPHIRRGIKGFVEFPKTIKVVQGKEEARRVDLESNLECQRAQLRVLLRNRNKASNASFGITLLEGNAQNLVM